MVLWLALTAHAADLDCAAFATHLIDLARPGFGRNPPPDEADFGAAMRAGCELGTDEGDRDAARCVLAASDMAAVRECAGIDRMFARWSLGVAITEANDPWRPIDWSERRVVTDAERGFAIEIPARAVPSQLPAELGAWTAWDRTNGDRLEVAIYTATEDLTFADEAAFVAYFGERPVTVHAFERVGEGYVASSVVDGVRSAAALRGAHAQGPALIAICSSETLPVELVHEVCASFQSPIGATPEPAPAPAPDTKKRPRRR